MRGTHLVLGVLCALAIWLVLNRTGDPIRPVAASGTLPLVPSVVTGDASSKQSLRVHEDVGGTRTPTHEEGAEQSAQADPRSEPKGGGEGLSEEQMLQMAAPQFAMTPQLESALAAGFRGWLSELSAKEASARVGFELDQQGYQRLVGVEAPFNADLEALADLYVGDYGQALQDTWVNGLYHFEEPLADGSFRAALPGESRMKFPGKAIYFTIDETRYPQLKDTTDKRAQVVRDRRIAIQREVVRMRSE